MASNLPIPDPPPPPRAAAEQRSADRGALIAAGLVCAAVALLYGFAGNADESVAFRVGSGIGGALVTLAIATLARLVYIRLVPSARGKPLLAPAVFVIASVLMVLVVLGRASDDADAAEALPQPLSSRR
jgi:hypothetical protein